MAKTHWIQVYGAAPVSTAILDNVPKASLDEVDVGDFVMVRNFDHKGPDALKAYYKKQSAGLNDVGDWYHIDLRHGCTFYTMLTDGTINRWELVKDQWLLVSSESPIGVSDGSLENPVSRPIPDHYGSF
jgi:hypothetical protein